MGDTAMGDTAMDVTAIAGTAAGGGPPPFPAHHPPRGDVQGARFRQTRLRLRSPEERHSFGWASFRIAVRADNHQVADRQLTGNSADWDHGRRSVGTAGRVGCSARRCGYTAS